MTLLGAHLWQVPASVLVLGCEKSSLRSGRPHLSHMLPHMRQMSRMSHMLSLGTWGTGFSALHSLILSRPKVQLTVIKCCLGSGKSAPARILCHDSTLQQPL